MKVFGRCHTTLENLYFRKFSRRKRFSSSGITRMREIHTDGIVCMTEREEEEERVKPRDDGEKED